MEQSTVLSLSFAAFVILLTHGYVSARNTYGSGVVDDATVEPNNHDFTDAFGVEQELTNFEEDLRQGKQRFKNLWKDLNNREKAQHIEDPVILQTMHRLWSETRRLRVSVSRNLRSLNNFIGCYTSCVQGHKNDTSAMASATDADIRYFCNHSCMLMIEQHHMTPHHETSPDGQEGDSLHPNHIDDRDNGPHRDDDETTPMMTTTSNAPAASVLVG